MVEDFFIFNTLSRKKELFEPEDQNKILMYVCGPTVYNYPHIGNARSVVVYDVLYRVLKFLYKNVYYVRNITDIDDKIIAASKKNTVSVSDISLKYEQIFKKNMAYINCLEPSVQPKVTENLDEIIQLISILLENNSAYMSNKGDIYFSIRSFKDYGLLSNRKLEDLIHGSRIQIEKDKKNSGDFVLWKLDNEDSWDSPWGKGRPGWHIECSALAHKYLGENFDIHGGGADLQFPHHENEIAQSCAAFPNSKFAKYWIHNGFVTVEGEKMSKSLGNVITVEDLYHKGIKGEIIKYILLNTHYRKPLNWNQNLLEEATNSLNKLYRSLEDINLQNSDSNEASDKEFRNILFDDLNTSTALKFLHELSSKINKTSGEKKNLYQNSLKKNANLFFGLLEDKQWAKNANIDVNYIVQALEKRALAKKMKNYNEADNIRKELESKGIYISDNKDGTASWYFKESV